LQNRAKAGWVDGTRGFGAANAKRLPRDAGPLAG
jgi:hypothetical protein